MKNDKETNQIIRTIKELFHKNKQNQNELSKLIDTYLIPQELEKKSNAEISTPYNLRNEMLDTIEKYSDTSFWKTPKKVFEPCSGKGGFLIDIINRFNEGLKDYEPDEKKRYKLIVEKCLYFSDINPTNIFINKLLLDPEGEYKLNYNEGDTLKLDIEEKWGLKGFDLVVGNPPYQAPRKKENETRGGGGDLIWNKFVKKCILENTNYLLFIHPSGWRKPKGLYKPINSKYKDLYELMCVKNNMLFLSIHNTKDGLKTFNCGTRYDWYLIKKGKQEKETIIMDEGNNKISINLKKIEFIPNKNIKDYGILFTNNIKDNIIILKPGSDIRRDYISHVKNDTYKYVMIHSTPFNGIRYMYSNTNKKSNDHFNIPKIIIGETNINPLLDYESKYGLTNGAFGIQINSKKEGENIIKAMKTDKFKEFIKACSWSNYRIDWRLFTYLKKDFWKEFI